jgi:hypothetical protein
MTKTINLPQISKHVCIIACSSAPAGIIGTAIHHFFSKKKEET